VLNFVKYDRVACRDVKGGPIGQSAAGPLWRLPRAARVSRRRPRPQHCHKNRYLPRSENDIEVVGLRRGREALTHLNLDDPASRRHYVIALDRENTRTIDRRGGTVLHSSRTNPSQNAEATGSPRWRGFSGLPEHQAWHLA
jgi:hypothetical protein